MRSLITIRLLLHLKDDTAGMAMSSELVLVATILVAGLMAGTATLRDAVISEISDVGGAVQDLQNSYHIDGITGHSSKVAGMSFDDASDFCDDAEDASGVADNCITFEVPPSDEALPISIESQVLNLNFDDGDATDTSPEGNNNSGVEIGDPDFTGGGVEFDGDDAIFIPNSNDINLGIHDERTISFTFNADDVTSTQVLYEEGGRTRGLIIYIDNGLLYIGGWNIPDAESGWDPVFISTPISAGVDNTVSLVLNGDGTVQPGALSGFLNGTQFGSAAGSQLWSHGGGIGIGATNGATILHTGNSTDSNFFTGSIDGFSIFNRALTDAELATQGH